MTHRLLYSDSEHNADMLYFCKAFVPDPFLAFEIHDQKIGVANVLEYSRLLKEAAFDTLLSYEAWREHAQRIFKLTAVTTAHIAAAIARHYKVKRFTIAPDFPSHIYVQLQALGLKLDIAPHSLFPERLVKGPAELRALRKANAASSYGIQAAAAILKASRIQNGYIYHKGQKLTSEYLRRIIDTTCLEHQAYAKNTIVASGKQACDPHHRGTGPIKAHTLIIIDVFPRDMHTGYYGDMTRTFLKGVASEAQRKLVHTVHTAQQKAIRAAIGGVSAAAVHQTVTDYFQAQGYVTERRKDQHVGFIHSTGHGLGLELHEAPRVSLAGPTLAPGMVVTIEPGLYYPEIGGVRIEDVIAITGNKPRKLSRCTYDWEIR